LNIRSWPAGLGIGDGSPFEYKDCLDVYGLNETSIKQFAENPLDKVEKLAKAGIPVALVAGDADTTVPYAENGKLFDQKYRRFGGKILTIVKPGCGHHPHSVEDPTPVVEFLLEATGRKN